MINTPINIEVITIQAHPTIIGNEAELRDVGRQLTKIIYNKSPNDNFKASLHGKILVIHMPIVSIEHETSPKQILINRLRRYIIDIVSQAKRHKIQIELIE
jgi:hypothetical protein